MESASGWYISDHQMVHINLNSKKEKHKHTQQELHKLDNNALQQFQQEFNNQAIINATTLSEAINQLKDKMLRTLNKVAPLHKKTKPKHAKKPWYDVKLLLQRKTVWNRECKWLKYREDHLWIAFKRERSWYNRMIK